MPKLAPISSQDFAHKSFDDLVDPVYDDGWLRELLTGIRTDVRELKEDLRAHTSDDIVQWRALHTCVDKVGADVTLIQDKLDEHAKRRQRFWETMRWGIALAIGGGLTLVFKLTGKVPW